MLTHLTNTVFKSKPSTSKSSKRDSNAIKVSITQVAIAVIHYKDNYLLGFRSRTQHQGNLYEFIGGKIEPNESASVALEREIREEVGIEIDNNVAVKLGRLHHDYGDKQVSLQVYKIELTKEQYAQHQHSDYGLEGQALSWVIKEELLNNLYPLPAANQTILSWLQLPNQIAITYPLDYFDNFNAKESYATNKAVERWLEYHSQAIPKDSWSYLRSKAESLSQTQKLVVESQLASQLISARPDIDIVIPYRLRTKLNELIAHFQKLNQNYKPSLKAYHLNQTELMDWYTHCKDHTDKTSNNGGDDFNASLLDSSDYAAIPLIVSCHDKASITAANQLAHLRLSKSLAPVIAIFLSPVLATQSHPDSATLSWDNWSDLAQLADMPVIALGGLSPTMRQISYIHGAICIAGISQFLLKNSQ